MVQIINGRVLATNIRDRAKEIIQTLPSRPGRAAILVGDDPASHLYVNLKEKACKDVGIRFEKYLYPADVAEDDLVKKIEQLNADSTINGILVQIPLPTQDENRVLQAIDPKKDVDGFHPKNLAALETGKPSLVPPVDLFGTICTSSGFPLERSRCVHRCGAP